VSRPPIATERLALTASGQVRYALKTPYRDGTTHLVLEPLELMARLAGGLAGLAGGRVCRARPVDGRLALTLRPVTRTRIGLDRWFEFPIRRVAFSVE
jgi:hypothetical protein